MSQKIDLHASLRAVNAAIANTRDDGTLTLPPGGVPELFRDKTDAMEQRQRQMHQDYQRLLGGPG